MYWSERALGTVLAYNLSTLRQHVSPAIHIEYGRESIAKFQLRIKGNYRMVKQHMKVFKKCGHTQNVHKHVKTKQYKHIARLAHPPALPTSTAPSDAPALTVSRARDSPGLKLLTFVILST